MDSPSVGSPFCTLMAPKGRTCDVCLKLQKQLEEEANLQPKISKCFASLCEKAVPVRVGDQLIAFSQTGRILVESPNRWQFEKITCELLRLGTHIDLNEFEEDCFAFRVLAPDQHESMVRLFTLFARILAACGNQLAFQRTEPGHMLVSCPTDH